MIKRSFFIIISCLLIISASLPVGALGPVVLYDDSYITETSAVIGYDGFPLTVMGDGSYTVTAEGQETAVSFGEGSADAVISFKNDPYPVSTHKYIKNGLDCKIVQFVFGDESGNLFVYSRFTVKNTNEDEMPFPAVSGAAPITTVPETVASEKKASCDYVLKISPAEAEAEAAIAAQAVDYDTAKNAMIAHWNSYFNSLLTFTSDNEETSEKYNIACKKEIVSSLIGAPCDHRILALASPDYTDRILTSDLSDPYSVALALSKTDNTEDLSHIASSVKKILEVSSFDGSTLYHDSLEKNLDILLAFQSYAHILTVLSPNDTELINYAENTATRFADSIADAIKKVENELSTDWEVSDTDSSYGIVLTSKNRSSAAALCSWYIKSSVFTKAPSKELTLLAKDAVYYYSTPMEWEDLALSLFSQKADGTVVIGRGAPFALFTDHKNLEIKNIYLKNGSKGYISFSVKGKEINISISGISAPLQIEFPAFDDNIEFASVGFDEDSGVITAPEGTTFVTVKLKDSLESLEKNRAADENLESAIAEAYAAEISDPTTVSRDAFNSALTKAEKARTSTASEKDSAAKNLRKATGELSPMVSGYTFNIPEEGDVVGTITNSEIYQKFSLPATGNVDTLFVRGVYSDSISAAVYTLRGDNYTTDELCAETYGTPADGGMTFDLDFEAEGEKVYVLCIFSEEEDVSLDLQYSKEHSAHTFSGGETTVYTNASLCLSFSVTQVDRSMLDTFYSACLEADVSEYTKESRKELDRQLKKAKTLLCTPSVTEEEYNDTYKDLRDAFDNLDTYASEDKMEEAPIVGLVLTGVVVILLCATLISAVLARKRMTGE